MRELTMVLFVALGLIASNVYAKTYSQPQAMALHGLHNIYVEDMGTSPEAARFRLLLEDQLSGNGFTVVAKREEADAVLGGAVSLVEPGVFGGPMDINLTARLNSSDGTRLWSVNTGGQIVIFNPVSSLKFKDPIEYRARELVRKLVQARRQSARAAGIKVIK